MQAWRAAGGVVAGFGVLATVLLGGVVSIASPPAFAVFVAALVTLMPFVFAALSWRNTKRRASELDTELDAAWMEAARALARESGSVTSAQLRDAFGITDEQAQTIASRLAASSEISTDVTEAGDLALSMRVPEKRRVSDGAKRAPAPEEPVEEPASDAQEEHRKEGA